MARGKRIAGMAAAVAVALLCAGAGAAPDGSPWLGVVMDPMSGGGVRVSRVLRNTPAERAGMRAGDVIVRVGDRGTPLPELLLEAVGAHDAGDRVAVEVARGGERRTVEVVLARRPETDGELLHSEHVGTRLPAIAFERVRGDGPASTSELTGRVTIIELWATWCRACALTHDLLDVFAAAQPAGGVAVLVVSSEERAAIETFWQERDVSFTVLRDPARAAIESLIVAKLPTLLVLDRDGVIRFAGVGITAAGEAVRAAEQLAAAGKAPRKARPAPRSRRSKR